MALVLGVMASSTRLGSIVQVTGSTSTKTGVAPAKVTAAAVAVKVWVGTITSCPGPILAAKKGIAAVPVGGIMEVLATDSGTLKDLPAWCKKVGHDFLGHYEEAGYLTLFVRKTK